MSTLMEEPVKIEIDPAEAGLWEMLRRLSDPGERMLIDAWVERNLQLPAEGNRYSGPIQISRTPYVRGVLRALSDPRFSRVLLCWAAQTGKTTVIQEFFAWLIDNDPGPTMLAYPNKALGHRRSRKHVLPLILANEVLLNRVARSPEALQNFAYQFDRMSAIIAWAGSSASLASDPIRYLLRDEIDKWDHREKNEGHPIDLSEVRVRSYDDLAKILDASTPGVKTGKTWTALEQGTFHQYYVPCPHCGKPDRMAGAGPMVTDATVEQIGPDLAGAGYQVLHHGGFTGHEGLKDPDQIRRSTVYRCACCKRTFPHSEVKNIGQHGVWVPKRIGVNLCTTQLATWYRDLEVCSFGASQARFEAARENKVELQSWVNNDAAEGWQEQSAARSKDEFRQHCRGYALGTIPFVPLYVIQTVDVRGAEIHVIVRAWTYSETSALVNHYLLPRLSKYDPDKAPTGESLAALDPYLAKDYPAVDGRRYGISVTAIDSGFETDEVYEYCRTRAHCIAMKGEERMSVSINLSKPQKIHGTKEPAPDSCDLISFLSDYFEDILNSRLNVSADAPGDWKLPADVHDDYLTHMISMVKKQHRDRWGRMQYRWSRLGTQPNHWRDDEKMQWVLCRYLNLREEREPSGPAATPSADSKPQLVDRDTSGFMDRLQR